MQRIAYLGPSGTFTEMALAQFEAAGSLDAPLTALAAVTHGAALEMVRSGEAGAAVVPIENSVAGSIAPTLDALASGSRLQIMAETELRVAFTVAVRPGIERAKVGSVAAYPVAAAQVSQWLAENLPAAVSFLSSSNAAAAEDVAAGRADAAVTTALAAQRCGLAVLASEVADYDGAVTRFVLVTCPRTAPPRTGADRTSLVVLDLPNEPGALMRVFSEFSLRGVDLTRIESRPTRQRLGTYHFHVDCVGHIDDVAVAEALKALHRTVGTIRYLGSWPACAPTGTPPPADEPAATWLTQLTRGSTP